MSVCNDIVLDDNHSDSLFIEINLTNAKKKRIVGVIYRPPMILTLTLSRTNWRIFYFP